ncbi:MAG: hypothetical protein LLG04_10855 [Parachlamydia sp.]|nr:hypothetical protein [Parachlamydia sp.]
MKQIDIPRRAQVCALGNESLGEGTQYYSALEEGPDRQVQRRDYCAACWEKVSSKGHRAFWKSKVLLKGCKKEAPKAVDFSRYAFLLLKEALHADTEESREEAFVLALYLARKRQLILRNIMDRGGEIYDLYEVVATEEMLAVKKMDLSTLKTEKVQDNLAKKFSSCTS